MRTAEFTGLKESIIWLCGGKALQKTGAPLRPCEKVAVSQPKTKSLPLCCWFCSDCRHFQESSMMRAMHQHQVGWEFARNLSKESNPFRLELPGSQQGRAIASLG